MPQLRMKAERKKHGWTQAFVAKKLSLTITSVSDMENGKAKPSYRVLCELEELYELTHRELFKIIK